MLPSVESCDWGRWAWVNVGPLTLHNVHIRVGVAECLQVSEADSPGTGQHLFEGNALSKVAGVGVCGIALV